MNIDDVLRLVRKRHPEQADVIDAFSPLVRVHVLLDQGEPGKKPLHPFTPQTMPIAVDNTLNAARHLCDALIEGFPDKADAFRTALTILEQRPSPVRTLCRALLSGDSQTMERATQRHSPDSNDALRLLLLQICRAMASRAAHRVRLPENINTGNHCPCCHSPADMSIL